MQGLNAIGFSSSAKRRSQMACKFDCWPADFLRRNYHLRANTRRVHEGLTRLGRSRESLRSREVAGLFLSVSLSPKLALPVNARRSSAAGPYGLWSKSNAFQILVHL